MVISDTEVHLNLSVWFNMQKSALTIAIHGYNRLFISLNSFPIRSPILTRDGLIGDAKSVRITVITSQLKVIIQAISVCFTFHEFNEAKTKSFRPKTN